MAAPTSATPLKQSQPSFGSATLQKKDIESQHLDKFKSQPSGESMDITAMPTITPYESTKFKVLLLISILGVVTLHSGGFAPSMVGKPDVSAFVQSLLAQGLARSSVPMCFVISGFFFFVPRADDAGGFLFWRRISARVKSIGIPYVLWNVVGAAELYALVRLPAIGSWFPQQWLHPKLDLLLVDMWADPAAGQLWYLRDLFLLCLFTPFFHYLFRIHHLLLLQLPLVVMVPWLLDAINPNGGFGPEAFLPFHVLRPHGVFFFTVGCYLALRGVDTTFRLPGWQAVCLLIAWLSIAMLYTTVFLLTTSQDTPMSVAIFVVKRLMDPLGVVSMWFGYDLLHKSLSDKWMWPWVLWLSNYSMWIYCMHDPVTEVVATAGRQFFLERSGSLGCLLFVLSFPVLIVVTTLLVGVSLSRCLPGLFGLLTGGRGV